MKLFLATMLLVCSTWPLVWAQSQNAVTPPSRNAKDSSPPAITLDKEALQNSDKAKSIIGQGIEALGGQTWLTIRDQEQQGRTYGFITILPLAAEVPSGDLPNFPTKK